MTESGGSFFRNLSRKWHLGCCLLDAMRYGRLQDVLAITKAIDVDPNILVPEYGIAPMHCAAGIDPEEFGVRCVKEFFKKGGDPNVKCSEGITPVHVASCWGRIKMLKILLINGGNPYLIDNEGNDAFFYAQGCDDVFQLLKNFNNDNKISVDNSNTIHKHENKLNIDRGVNENEDQDLNSLALSLIVKHRQDTHLFESLPEEDTTSSSTTLDTEFTEDFMFEPRESLEMSNKSLENKLKKSTQIESDEICTENILISDKSQVIKLINENVEKTQSQFLLNSNYEDKNDQQILKNSGLNQIWVDMVSNDLEKCFNDTIMCNRFDSEIKNENADAMCESVNIITSSITAPGNNTNIRSKLDRTLTKSWSDNSDISIKKSKSKIERYSTKSESEEIIYRTPNESKELKRNDSKSSVGSTSSDNNIQLPKKVREKLLCFKINTHYKTRVFRMISRSCDGLRYKKSLYSTGFEFWSTKVKSKSYPLYIGPRRPR